MPATDPSELLAMLVRAPSVTPDVGRALDIVEQTLAAAGFSIERPVFHDTGTPDVENLFAAAGNGARHLTFAGHVDVVPTGDEAQWSHPPFAGETAEGVLYGRGAIDMKSGVAAMMVAASRFLERRGADFGGRISFLITGDEEGPAINGTAKLLAWAVAGGEQFSAAIVGEPASRQTLGDQVKIGRRGSFSAAIEIEGRQGHAAYPHLADNPLRGLATFADALLAEPLDAGTEHFEPTSLELVSVDTGNPAWNIIPGRVSLRLNSRFNDLWTQESLQAEIGRRLTAAADDRRHRPGAAGPIRWRLVAEPAVSDVFLTRDEALIDLVRGAMRSITGITPALSTGGGTSDARFIKDYCPVIEVGAVGTTMHQTDECVPLADVANLTRIYEAILDAYFPG